MLSYVFIKSNVFFFFVYVNDKVINFGYSGNSGPDKWGSLSPDFATCSQGKNQSPVNIIKENNGSVPYKKMVPVQGDYTDPNATLVNNGFNIALHLIHFSDDGDIAIVAILYKYGDEDKILLQFEDQLSQLAQQTCSADQETHIPIGVLNTKSLRRQYTKFWSYSGSLTTPPCIENVNWIIIGKIREISEDQVAALQAPLGADYKNNSRPVQAMNERSVFRFNLAKEKRITNGYYDDD
ncbi:putative carbonic anhydrase [Dioscorea sansibarensis]